MAELLFSGGEDCGKKVNPEKKWNEGRKVIRGGYEAGEGNIFGNGADGCSNNLTPEKSLI